jgi:hypothetical protein
MCTERLLGRGAAFSDAAHRLFTKPLWLKAASGGYFQALVAFPDLLFYLKTHVSPARSIPFAIAR